MKENIGIGLTDKNGVELPNECIIYGPLVGQTEKHYFNIFIKPNDGTVEMIACTYGYVHNIKQEDLVNFEFVGLAKDNMRLLECD